MKFWMTMFNVLVGSLLGGIIAAFNGGDRIDSIILGFLFIVWFEVRDVGYRQGGE